MPIMFNSILRDSGINPKNVRLLRHKDAKRATKGRAPYLLWRDKRGQFELYQSRQNTKKRPTLRSATHWASFVGTRNA
jgi:neutral trehalase